MKLYKRLSLIGLLSGSIGVWPSAWSDQGGSGPSQTPKAKESPRPFVLKHARELVISGRSVPGPKKLQKMKRGEFVRVKPTNGSTPTEIKIEPKILETKPTP